MSRLMSQAHRNLQVVQGGKQVSLLEPLMTQFFHQWPRAFPMRLNLVNIRIRRTRN